MFPAPYGAYETKDGYLVLSFADMPTLAKALEEPELAKFKNEDTYPLREEITLIVARAMLKRATREWEDILTGYNLWHAPVNDYAAVEKDPQVAYLDSFEQVEGATETPLTLVKHPVQYNGERPQVRMPPQPLGAQTEQIMRELGYPDSEIKQLAAKRIIGLGPQAD
ncbi:MAG: hypothetical protein GTO41_03970 [Burkholderiales bacterium]|nr:hypothetical protein [Burkholderiales bacterium]